MLFEFNQSQKKSVGCQFMVLVTDMTLELMYLCDSSIDDRLMMFSCLVLTILVPSRHVVIRPFD